MKRKGSAFVHDAGDGRRTSPPPGQQQQGGTSPNQATQPTMEADTVDEALRKYGHLGRGGKGCNW